MRLRPCLFVVFCFVLTAKSFATANPCVAYLADFVAATEWVPTGKDGQLGLLDVLAMTKVPGAPYNEATLDQRSATPFVLVHHPTDVRRDIAFFVRDRGQQVVLTTLAEIDAARAAGTPEGGERLREERAFPALAAQPGDPDYVAEHSDAWLAGYALWFGGSTPMIAMAPEYQALAGKGLDRKATFATIGERMRLFVDVMFDQRVKKKAPLPVRFGDYLLERVDDRMEMTMSPWGDAQWGSMAETKVTDVRSGKVLVCNFGTAHMALHHHVLEKGVRNRYATSVDEFLAHFSAPLPPYAFDKNERLSESGSPMVPKF